MTYNSQTEDVRSKVHRNNTNKNYLKKRNRRYRRKPKRHHSYIKPAKLILNSMISNFEKLNVEKTESKQETIRILQKKHFNDIIRVFSSKYLHDLIKESCYGCISDNPSQWKHECIMIEKDEWIRIYFDDIISKLDFELIQELTKQRLSSDYTNSEVCYHVNYYTKKDFIDSNDWKENLKTKLLSE